tara:strand:- start:163 stop:324 length:162 start_codon:yes stop_codon:yes gene_type:complete
MIILKSPDGKWEVKILDDGKVEWFNIHENVFGKYSTEQILEAMDQIDGIQKSK